MIEPVSCLKHIHQFFKENSWELDEYKIPSLWVTESSKPGISTVKFNNFYQNKLEEILQYDKQKFYNQSISIINNEHHGIGGDWSYHSVVYNAFPRFTTAFDHDGIGDLKDIEHQGKKVRKTGTFLKMIALLPYIKSLGCNVLHLMPITKIGIDGNRGDLGSPYAIKNPYELDERLAETAIPFTVEEQFKALVEACHILNIRVVLEFVLRTAAIDSDWIKQHPDWFYWIKKEKANSYKKPVFTPEELKLIKKIPEGHNLFIPPNKEYQDIFSKPPRTDQIEIIENKIVAKTEEGELIIPGAFADWPPDDKQPPWNDVTYLKLYHDDSTQENFNYIAYNTIRYYDPKLRRPENKNTELWNALTGIIPHYQQHFGIDGIMLDMGHALPNDLMNQVINRARDIDPDFGFWEENFEIRKDSRWIGFNATLGFEWKFKEHQVGMRNVLLTASQALAIPFFGTPETHNTPRIIDTKIKQQYWIINSLMPSCLPFIHAGYELNEEHPVNTGLNFSAKQLNFYADFPLALFNRRVMNWSGPTDMLRFIQKMAKLRIKNEEWIATGDERTLKILYPENSFGKVLAFERHDAYQPWKTIIVIMNINMEEKEKFFLHLHGTFNNKYIDYLSGELFAFEDHWLSGELDEGSCLIFEIHKLI